MSIPIIIGGTTINIPSSGESPNWAPAIIEAFQAIQNTLNSFAGPYDVPSQIFVMTSNANTNVSLPNLTFPSSNVQGAIITYSVYRNTSSVTATETGQIFINYNATNPTNSKWEISQELVGDAQVSFNITDIGQVQFSSVLLAGTAHNGIISYQAKSITNS